MLLLGMPMGSISYHLVAITLEVGCFLQRIDCQLCMTTECQEVLGA